MFKVCGFYGIICYGVGVGGGGLSGSAMGDGRNEGGRGQFQRKM